MLSPRWRKVLRDIWLHKSRTMLVVLAIAVGIAGAGSILNAWALVEVATKEGFLASNPAAATLRTDSVDDALLDRVRALPAIRDAQARRSVLARVQAGGAWQNALMFVFDDFTAIRIGKISPEAGAWPPADGSFVIERSSLEFSGAAVGESLSVVIGDARSRALHVTGIARDVGLAPGWMEHVVYGFVTRATLAQLGAPTALNELQVVVRESGLDQEAVRQVAFEVKALMEQSGHRVYDVNVPVPGEHIHAPQMDSLLLTQGAFGALALLLSAFLVVNLIAAMLAGQVREIGVMKAIGARAGQLGSMYLGVALFLGLVASGLAIPVAALVGRQYGQLKADLLNFKIDGFSVPLWVTAVQFTIGTLLPVAAAAFPVRRGCRITVSDALRDVGIDGNRAGDASALLGRARGLTRPILLSLRNAFRRRQRMVLTLLALSTGGAVFLGARNLRASVVSAVDLLFSVQKYDFAIRLAEPHAPDSLEAAVRRVSGVTAAEAWLGARGAVPRADSTLGNAFAMVALPLGSPFLAPLVEQGRWLAAGDSNDVVLSRSVLNGEPGLRVGDATTLVINGKASTWQIVGVVETGPGPTAYASRDFLARVMASGGATSVVIRSALGGTASKVELISRVRRELDGAGLTVASSTLLAENRRVTEDHLLMVSDFLAVMGWLMIVVGGLGLASTMSLAVLERTREIGVLRAIGARHRSIFTIVQVEGLVIAVMSWAFALPLSIPMSVILGTAFGRIMIKVPITYVPEAAGVLLWLALVIVVSVAACAWPAIRAMRVTTSAALAYE